MTYIINIINVITSFHHIDIYFFQYSFGRFDLYVSIYNSNYSFNKCGYLWELLLSSAICIILFSFLNIFTYLKFNYGCGDNLVIDFICVNVLYIITFVVFFIINIVFLTAYYSLNHTCNTFWKTNASQIYNQMYIHCVLCYICFFILIVFSILIIVNLIVCGHSKVSFKYNYSNRIQPIMHNNDIININNINNVNNINNINNMNNMNNNFYYDENEIQRIITNLHFDEQVDPHVYSPSVV